MRFKALQEQLDPARRLVVAIATWLVRKFENPRYRAVVSFLRDLFHILWICRIATFSAVLGILVMWQAPQARDLFQEVAGFAEATGKPTAYRSFLFALTFAGSILLLWVIPLHGAARWSLDSLANPPRTLFGKTFSKLTKPRPRLNPYLVEYVPWVLGGSCFLAVWIGLSRASEEIFDPNVIGTAQFSNEQIGYLYVTLAVAAVLFFLYTFYRHKSFKLLGRLAKRPVRVKQEGATRVVSGPGVFLIRFIGAAFVTIVSVVLLLYIVAPQSNALESRILLVPIILGAWVPVLSVVTWLSYPARVPILTLLIVIIVGYKALVGEGHEVTIIEADRASAPGQIEIKAAIDLWKLMNDCLAPETKCPRPVVVAAAGGASRAAFVTASTLGLFMDLTCRPDAAPDGDVALPCSSKETPVFANRVFAISGVSGGALGAAVFSALLKARQETEGPVAAPCDRQEGRGAFWFRPFGPQGWRDCLQLILSEDFLSPPVLGLAFRDQLPFLDLFASIDRAALLEDTWISAFGRYVKPKTAPAAEVRPGIMEELNATWACVVGFFLTPKDPPAVEPRIGLAAPFDSFAPDSNHWRPLLVLNGTSVATGRRILTSHIASGKGATIFHDAYDFFTLIEREAPQSTDGKVRTISLATAVTNSARFPIISPQGVLWNRSKTVLQDRIVDGGYFENYGITTAYEIARVLKLNGLNPFILLTTNDPISVARVRQFDGFNTLPAPPGDQRDLPVAALTSPFLALYATRNSRGDLAIMRTAEALVESAGKDSSPLNNQIQIAHVAVYGLPANSTVKIPPEGTTADMKLKEVSMSWWLSKPVQEYLDSQYFWRRYSVGQQQVMLTRVCGWLGGTEPKDISLSERCKKGVKAFVRDPEIVPPSSRSLRSPGGDVP